MEFDIDHDLLEAFDDYVNKAKAMQNFHYDKCSHCDTHEELKLHVDDDLVFHIPIYDVLHRRAAVFCSFLEALHKGEKDSKGNGKWFPDIKMDYEHWVLLYLSFRLAGSGINYVPKHSEEDPPFGTHGFGNFWLVQELAEGKTHHSEWFDALKKKDGPFVDVKGYMLPQISYPGMKSGHLKRFMLEELKPMADEIVNFTTKHSPVEIYQVVDHMNEWLRNKGYKRQNFVLTAATMDIAEYHPEMVSPMSRVYAGSTASKCIKDLFIKKRGVKKFDHENHVLSYLAERYNTEPYSAEDILCDFGSRYLNEFQSKDHIIMNNGIKHQNNSILKRKWGNDQYYKFIESRSRK